MFDLQAAILAGRVTFRTASTHSHAVNAWAPREGSGPSRAGGGKPQRFLAAEAISSTPLAQCALADVHLAEAQAGG